MPEIQIDNQDEEPKTIRDPSAGELMTVEPGEVENKSISAGEFFRIKSRLQRLVQNPDVYVDIRDRIEDHDDIGLPVPPGNGTTIHHRKLLNDPDGVRTTFELPKKPIPGTTTIFVNSLSQKKTGPGSSYTQNGRYITFNTAPDPDDHLTTTLEYA